MTTARYRLQGWDDESIFLNIEERVEGSENWICLEQVDLSKHPEIEQLATDMVVMSLKAKGVIA